MPYSYPNNTLELYKEDRYRCERCYSNSLTCGCHSFAEESKEVKAAISRFRRGSSRVFLNPTPGTLYVESEGNQLVFYRFKLVKEVDGHSHVKAVKLPDLDQLIYFNLAVNSSVNFK